MDATHPTDSAPTKRTQRPAQRHRRGVRVGDVALAVMVAAVGFAWTRAYWGRLLAEVGSYSWSTVPETPGIRRAVWIGGDPAYNSARNLSILLLTVGATLASTGSVALVFARRWRHPTGRTPLWRARRPGALASLLTVGALAGTLGWHAVRLARPEVARYLIGPRGEVRAVASEPLYDWSRYSLRVIGSGEPFDLMIEDERPAVDPFRNAPLTLPRWLGFVIGGAWLMLGAARAWRAERSTLDRLGRVVGVYWIVAAVYFLILPL